MSAVRRRHLWFPAAVAFVAFGWIGAPAAAADQPSSFPSSLTRAGTNLFFAADDGTHGREIWVSRNAFAGTTFMIADLNAGGDSNPAQLTALGSRVLFTADDGAGEGLWVANGTGSIVQELFDEPDRGPTRLTRVGSSVFFVVRSPLELWMTDGTVGGTEIVEQIPGSSSVTEAVALNGILYFLVSTETADGAAWRLWRSDGTPGGTFVVKRIVVAGDHFEPWQLTATSNLVYFIRDNQNFAGGIHPAAQLWRSDGTAAGTRLVKDIVPDDPDGVDDLTPVGSTLYFTTYDADGDRELWKSNGAAAGTMQVANINPGDGSHPMQLTRVGTELYFSADDGDGRDLWLTNGTEQGTKFVDPAQPYECALFDFDCIRWPYAPAGAGGLLFFPSSEGSGGIELWVSDGTEAGTQRVKNINAGSAHSRPSDLTRVESLLYFVARDGTHGRELWVTDGTAPGTYMIEDINSG